MVCFRRSLVAGALVLWGAACSAPGGTQVGVEGGGALGDASAPRDAGSADADLPDTGQRPGPDGSTKGSGEEDGGAGPDSGVIVDCTDLQVKAEPVPRPVDVIWVVDNSGSMDREAAAVGANLIRFADTMTASGLDYRVVLISKADFVPEYATLQATLPADRFRFVDTNVGSHDGLDALFETYNDYRDFLRPTAVTHFVVVTDDEARREGGWLQSGRVERTRDWFMERMGGRLGKDFVLHAVASEDPRCKGAAAVGEVYYALAARTGGETWSICTQDWSGLFTTLSTAVEQSSGVACSVPMPEPPDGLPLNPEQVTITLTDGAGASSELARVANQEGCVAGGWHYDRPLLPSAIELCAATCETIQDDEQARLDVTIACGSDACAGVGTQADIQSTPVDIVWVIDNSGSMKDEAQKISANVGAFAQTMDAAGVDFRVIFLTDADKIDLGIPLGDRFRYAEVSVDSHDALMRAVESYDQYKAQLRDDSVVHFVVVSDDESNVPDGLEGEGGRANTTPERAATVQWFLDQMGHPDRLGRSLSFHAIVGKVDGDCATSDNRVENVGQTYMDLSARTGGRVFDICRDDWSPLFGTLAEAVLSSAPVDCSFALPEPPEGQVFVADKVNVRYAHAGAAQPTVVGKTSGPDACDAGGWYYDDPAEPGQIELCPVTCEQVQSQLGAAVEIQFGCESEIVRIQ